MPTTSSEANTPLNTAPITHREMMAVLGTIDELVLRMARVMHVAQDLQATLPELFAHVDTADCGNWVRNDDPKTPAEIEARYANLPDGHHDMWVVYIEHERGVYNTNKAADFQVKGCPGQQYWKRTSKRDTLNFYAEKYALREVQKWVQEL
ncbi:hypothetical protein K438DRAFT_1760477 [Mycena galopus ATCC 62051]|nr:hypothetical protein K438DRAFT_1760477 [Mycena galopus ATCC 62051]